jgi:riboflavin kinase/FMN adenylyltransferase
MASIIELKDLDKNFFKELKVVAAIGFFDGIHRGHSRIIEMCVKRASEINGKSLIFTFDKPPMNIITGKLYKRLIINFGDKFNLIEKMGVDYILVAKFSKEFANMAPVDFCRDILAGVINVKELFIGEDFRFGRNASGDVSFIEDFFSGSEVTVNRIPILEINGTAVSSTAIRDFYNKGNIDNIISFLGRAPSVKGRVVSGESIGRELGFPTANIVVFEKYIIPKDGVYVGYVELVGSGSKYGKLNAVINVGINPTFDGTHKRIESHIIDFDEDIYNREIEVFFIKRLRDEVRFKNKNDLIEQIKTDISTAKEYFKKESVN